MPERGLRLGTILGIPVRLDWSVVAIFLLIAWSLSASLYPELVGGYSTAEYWIAGIGTAFLFFGSLLAHELSHSVVAQRLGIHVRDITLWLFGGVSTIEGEAHSPRDELRIAIVGPATSFAIAVGGALVGLVISVLHGPRLIVGAALWLAVINGFLAVFNLAPAAPLDGGRVLHAWLWHRGGSRTKAGISASRAGQVFGWVLVGVGLVEFVSIDVIGGLWLVILGYFLVTAARAEEQQSRLSRDLRGVRVADVMTRDPITVPDDASADDVVDEYVLRHHCSAFPVVGRDGSLRGLVTLARVRSVPPDRRPATNVASLAWPLSSLTVAAPQEFLLDVLMRLGTDGEGDGRILVLDNGRLVGIVSPSDVSRAVQIAEWGHAA